MRRCALSLYILPVLLTISLSSFSYAQSEAGSKEIAHPVEQSSVDVSSTVEHISIAEQTIKHLNSELENLNDLIKKTHGQDNLALQYHTFQKNELLRDAIGTAIRNNSADRNFLYQQVKQQQYTSEAAAYLNERTTKLADQLNSAKGSDKFALLARYEEAIIFLDSMLVAQQENIEWLKALDRPSLELAKKLEQEISLYSKQTVADIQLLRHKIRAEQFQVSVAPEAEQPKLQLNLMVNEQLLNIHTRSLRVITEISDNLALPTAELKRLYFEVTGSLTQDLLNSDVIVALLKKWSRECRDWLIENAPQYAFQIIVFLIIILTTYFVVKIIRNLVRLGTSAKKLKISQLMQEFIVSMIGRVVMLLGFLVALSQIGINLTPILTGFGIASIIIGFALQDALANFAAGMMLLIYRPFDVGDYVSAGGVEGKVSHLTLVNTTIKTFDNQIIMVPNSTIWNGVIKNMTYERVRRVDMVFSVSYSDNVEQVEQLLAEIVADHPATLRSPAPLIKLQTLNTSSVDFIVRPWTKTDDYWDVYWDITRTVKIKFEQEGITIPFPQQDVYLYPTSAEQRYRRRSHRPVVQQNIETAARIDL